jgi:hypothetical protein
VRRSSETSQPGYASLRQSERRCTTAATALPRFHQREGFSKLGLLEHCAHRWERPLNRGFAECRARQRLAIGAMTNHRRGRINFGREVIKGTCLTEKNRFLVPLVDYIVMKNNAPDSDQSAVLSAANSVITQYYDVAVKNFIEKRSNR